jgi:predicted aspartyl protease
MQLDYDSVEEMKLGEDGHYHLTVPIFYETDSYTSYKADFVFDTGAYITVVTRATATDLGFLDSHTIESGVKLSGFMGGCLADIKEIPGLFVGGRFFEDVKVAVPHEATDPNILGLNVIDYLKFYVDTEHDKAYFSLNPQPDIPQPLRCGSVRIVSPPTPAHA